MTTQSTGCATRSTVVTAAIHVYGGDFVREPRSQWGPGERVERPYDHDFVNREFADGERASRARLMAASVTGPVTGGSRGWPFSLPRADLDAIGYVAEEFFLDGTATAYEAEPGAELGIDGKWSVRPSRSAPFRTRMLVVRPTDPTRFNGIVHVNWQNVTAGFEIGTADSDQLLDGFAWVGVSAQRAGLEGFPGMEHVALKGWDPERYGTLDHPGDDFSFDIYTQAARAIGPCDARRTHAGEARRERRVAIGDAAAHVRERDPAAGARLRRVLVPRRLRQGIGARHEPASTPRRCPWGSCPPCRFRSATTSAFPRSCSTARRKHPRLYPVRQPDTDTLRLWEVAGTCHTGGTSSQTAMAELFERDGIAFALGGAAGSTAAPENPNVLSFTPANRAAFQHFHTWIRGGATPPPQPRIEFEAADEPTIRRDRFGNALGGIRLPDFAVPTGEHMGTGKGDVLASLVGFSRPFTPEELAELYPNREAYLSRWHAALDHGVEAGFILPEDAPAMKAVADETAATVFPK